MSIVEIRGPELQDNKPETQQAVYVRLGEGDPAPWFHARSFGNPNYAFDTAAGRYLVLCFFLTAADDVGKAAVKAALESEFFDDNHACFFGISVDPSDESERRIADRIPGLRFFLDFDASICRLYGAAARNVALNAAPARRLWMVLDPTMRVIRVIPFEKDGSDRDKLFRYLDSLPPPQRFAGVELQAPVLILPNVFEPDFCQHLIDRYEQHGGVESGFMREVGGKTMAIHDHNHKRRRDYDIDDNELITQTRERVRRRVVPEILKVHQYKVTRMERYIVSCYAAEDGGHFNAHRDNTTKGTAHRRFAVSINLNADFDGGEVSFPEYGPRSFKMPPGGACVFSCSLLHKVSKVTRGKRYAFLPFLYDDDAAKIREQNNQFLGEGVGAYRK